MQTFTTVSGKQSVSMANGMLPGLGFGSAEKRPVTRSVFLPHCVDRLVEMDTFAGIVTTCVTQCTCGIAAQERRTP